MENKEQEQVDALCPECGHAFKSYIDRLLHADEKSSSNKAPECPICGCGDCKIGK